MTAFSERILALLAARGHATVAPGQERSPVRLRNDSDGRGPYVETWDEAVLGPAPSQADGFARGELDRRRDVEA